MDPLIEWHQSFLRCAICGKELAHDGESLSCGICRFSLHREGNVWRDTSIESSDAENPCGDIDYAQRAGKPYTSTAGEEPQYKSHIQQAMQRHGPPSVAIDFGCGDGRFTQWLLSLGVELVIAIDIDLLNLKRLERKLTKKEQTRTLLLQADVFRLPLRRESVDAILAIGVLNLFGPRFEEVSRKLRDTLRPKGLFVNSEPTLEGSLLYALVRHDLNEFLEVARTGTKAIDIERSQSPRVPVLEHRTVATMLQRSGFRLLESNGISVFPSLVFGGLLRMGQYANEVKEQLAILVEELARRSVPVNRVVMYVSEKSVSV